MKRKKLLYASTRDVEIKREKIVSKTNEKRSHEDEKKVHPNNKKFAKHIIRGALTTIADMINDR